MRKLHLASLFLAFLYASVVFSQEGKPMGAVPAPRNDFKAEIHLDRSGYMPIYTVGEDQIKYTVNVNQDSYIYIYEITPHDEINLIVPNEWTGQQVFQPRNQTKTYPSANDSWELNIGPPHGETVVVLYATKNIPTAQELASNRLGKFRGGRSFADVDLNGRQEFFTVFGAYVAQRPETGYTIAYADYKVSERPGPTATIESLVKTKDCEWLVSVKLNKFRRYSDVHVTSKGTRFKCGSNNAEHYSWSVTIPDGTDAYGNASLEFDHPRYGTFEYSFTDEAGQTDTVLVTYSE